MAARRKVVVAAESDELRLAARLEEVVWVNVHALDLALRGVELLGTRLVEGELVGRNLVVMCLLELGADVASVTVRRARRAVRGGAYATRAACATTSARAASARASNGPPTGRRLGRRMVLRVLAHVCQEIRAAPGLRRLGLAGQIAILKPLDSRRELVLTRLDRRFQPAGTATAVLLLERVLELLQLGLPRREPFDRHFSRR